MTDSAEDDLHEAIAKEEAQDVDSDSKGPDGPTEQDEEDRMDPSAWWFASTMCPLLAGTLGPVASAFSVCALAVHWREYIPPGGTETSATLFPDPHWLDAINGVSLAFALVGNFALLMNMARRLRFDIAQPLSIVGFFTAGLLLIADLAALTGLPHYDITQPNAQPKDRHALTSAFYYAIWASALYMIIAGLMCLTIYGANKKYYEKEFNLTPSQRTMMLQTMSFVIYLLLGALVFSVIEDWDYLDAVYWADVTLLTIGLGDITPSTNVGKGLLFPFAIGGVLIVGLVVGSIRSLVLERGEEKMAARIIADRRKTAVHSVDEHRQTIKVSWFSRAEFSLDPALSHAQRRQEEFDIMRKVQAASETEQLYLGLLMSTTVALVLWFVGAAIFTVTEAAQSWTYLDALYFAFTSLLTIGYGDYSPASNSGRAFFVFWSLLAVPSLTILISNMGDTIVKWVTELTNFIASVTVLPGKEGFRKTAEHITQQVVHRVTLFTPPGILGIASNRRNRSQDGDQHRSLLRSRIAARLKRHVEKDEFENAIHLSGDGSQLERDIHFYHYVLSRECRNLQSDLSEASSKRYSWEEWEYYLRLMGEENDFHDNLVSSCTANPNDQGTEKPERPQSDGKKTNHARRYKQNLQSELDEEDALHGWSWLSNRNPLIASRSETSWILDRLSAALERDLNNQRQGRRRKPPISYRDMHKGADDRTESREAKA